MTLPESTSGRDRQPQCSAVEVGVVGLIGVPAAVYHPDPGSGQDAYGVREVVSSCSGAVVGVGGPRAGVSAVIGASGPGEAEALVAGPPEVNRELAFACLRRGTGEAGRCSA